MLLRRPVSPVPGIVFCQFLLLSLMWISPTDAEQIFKWRDAAGKLHFTDSEANIPARYRNDAQEHQSHPALTVPDPEQPREAGADPTAPQVDETAEPVFSVPYVSREGSASRIIIDVTFNDRVTAPIMVDTGSPGLVISAELASRLGLFQRDGSRLLVVISGIGGSTVALRTIVDRLKIGGAQEDFVPAHIVDNMAEAYQGLIGMDVLSGYTLTIDPAQQRLIATPNPQADKLPGGRGQHWWRGIFHEFQFYNDFWEQQADAIKSSSSPFHNLPSRDFNEVRDFIEVQRRESSSLLQKLDRQARWKLVPRHWRR